MKRVKIHIDREHSRKLIEGKPIALKVPQGTDVVEIRLEVNPLTNRDTLSKCIDVFFNHRPA